MPDGADMIRLLLAIILVPFIHIFMVRSILDLANFIQVDKVKSILLTQRVHLAVDIIVF